MHADLKISAEQLYEELQRAHRAAEEINAQLDDIPLLDAGRASLERELQASLNRIFMLALAYEQARAVPQRQNRAA